MGLFTRRRITDRTRKQLKFGPMKAHYFRNYALKISRDGAEGGFKSHGFKFGSRSWRLLGSLTINLTNRTWTWDRPGPGATHGSWGARRDASDVQDNGEIER